MANTVSYAGSYELEPVKDAGGNITGFTVKGAYGVSGVLYDIPLDETGTPDGQELAGESVGVTDPDWGPGKATYSGYATSDGIIVRTDELEWETETPITRFFLYTDNSSIVDGSTLGGVAATSPWTYPVCFLPGTLIATPGGERAIETLSIGDEITLASGEHRPLKWIGRHTTRLNPFNRATASPVLIRAGALGGGLPRRDLYTTYRHGFALEGVLVIAGVLINGRSIVQCSDWPEESVTFYQLEVEGHELMLVEGAAAETFGEDGDNRMLFENADEYRALYPDSTAGEPMPLGRVIVARQVPRAVRERIAAAAAELEQRVA